MKTKMKAQNRNGRILALIIVMVVLAISPCLAQIDSSKNTRQIQMPPNQTNPNTPQNQPAYPVAPNQTNPNPPQNQPAYPVQPNQTVPNSQPNQQTIPNPQPPSHTDPKKEQMQLSQPNQQPQDQTHPDSRPNTNKVTDTDRKAIIGNDKAEGKDAKGHQLYRASDGRRYYVNENGVKIYVK